MTRSFVRCAPLFLGVGILVALAGCTSPFFTGSGDLTNTIVPGQSNEATATTVRSVLSVDVANPGANQFYLTSLVLQPEGGVGVLSGVPATFHVLSAGTLAAAQAGVFAVANQLCPETEDAIWYENKNAKFQSITNQNGVIQVAPQSAGIDPGQENTLGYDRPRLPVLPGAMGWITANAITLEQSTAFGQRKQQYLGNVRLNYASPARLTGTNATISEVVFEIGVPIYNQLASLINVEGSGLPAATAVSVTVTLNGGAAQFTVNDVTDAAGYFALDFGAVAGLPTQTRSVDNIVITIN